MRKVLSPFYWIGLQLVFLGAANLWAGAPRPGTSPFIERQDVQVFAANCKATRKWVKLMAGEGSEATRKINTWIEKQVTAGKKLKASDCPDPKDSENYEYENTAEVTAAVGELVGVSVSVYFPGGSGRVARDCVVFRTQTGERFALKRYLKAKGKALLVQQFCESAKKEPETGADPAYFCSSSGENSAVADALYCLNKDGIQVSAPHNGNYRLVAQEKLIGWKGMKDYFQFPEALKRLGEPQ